MKLRNKNKTSYFTFTADISIRAEQKPIYYK